MISAELGAVLLRMRERRDTNVDEAAFRRLTSELAVQARLPLHEVRSACLAVIHAEEA